MGFPEENLTTPESIGMHLTWKNNSCQPNFWRNVSPDPTTSCGPYSPLKQVDYKENDARHKATVIDRYNHDTIGIVAIDSLGRVASATSSNGARNKIAG